MSQTNKSGTSAEDTPQGGRGNFNQGVKGGRGNKTEGGGQRA